MINEYEHKWGFFNIIYMDFYFFFYSYWVLYDSHIIRVNHKQDNILYVQLTFIHQNIYFW